MRQLQGAVATLQPRQEIGAYWVPVAEIQPWSPATTGLRDSSLPRPYQGKIVWGRIPLTALVCQRICKFNIQGWVWPIENTQIQPIMTWVQFKPCQLPYYANSPFPCCKQAVQRGFPGVHVKHFPTSTTVTTCELSILPASLNNFKDRTTDGLPHVWFSTSQTKRIVSKPILLKCHTSAWLLLEDLPYKSCPDTILQASDKTSLWCQDWSTPQTASVRGALQ